MARAKVQGPKFRKLRGRELNRNLLSQGKVRRRTGKGTFVDFDVSPLYTAVADGLAVGAAEMLAEASANAPDDPTTQGARIPESGIWAVYGFGGLLETGGPGEWRKPRTFRPIKDGVDAVISFKSGLHHLHELGTVKMPARPYLGPARMAMAERLPGILAANFPKEGPDA